ncbi:MAG: hypothetical protein KBT44_06880 [Bacteroidales bacterium]|nr:hypothetical protein [Candidatus Equibacterium intestinale]
MKRFTTILAIAAVCLVAASCGQNKKNQKTVEQEKSQAELNQEALIKLHLDTLSNDISNLQAMGVIANVKDGRIVLSEQEKKLKPDYLVDPSIADNLQTLSQKYRAIAILACDKEIAKLYGMPTAAYDKALIKLYADVNDSNLKDFIDSPGFGESLKTYYQASKDNGRAELFWDATAAAIVEELYIASQNTEKFLAGFDDEAASNISYHISLLSIAVEELATINSEYESLNESMQPLVVINAINLDQLKEQLSQMKSQISSTRGILTE